MGVTIGSNIQSLKAQRQLAKSTDALSRVFERLASGLRINHAADDAAGLAVSQTLTSDARVFGQALRNVNDGISALSIAEGALSALSSVVVRQSELAQQAANGSFSSKQRAALQTEVDGLRAEFNRIIQSTSFNDQKLLEDPQFQLSIQAGYGTQATLSGAYSNDAARNVGSGQAGSILSETLNLIFGAAPADLNADGTMDLVHVGAGVLVARLGNGDGTFATTGTYSTSSGGFSMYQVELADLNGDGVLDAAGTDYNASEVSVLLGNRDGSFGAASKLQNDAVGKNRTIKVGDLNGDGINDIATQDLYTSNLAIFVGNGDGSFKTRVTYNSSGSYDLELADFDSDGDLDVVGSTLMVLLNNGDGSFAARKAYGIATSGEVEVADLNSDGVLDIIQSFSGAGNGVQVAFGNGNGSFKAVTNLVFGGTDHRGLTVGDLNDDGNVDIVTAEMAENAVYTLLGNGDGTFMSAQRINTTGNSRRVLVEDFNNDFIADILATDFTVGGSDMIFQSHARTVLQGAIDVSTQSAARKSLDKLRIDLDRISKGQSSIGAFQSRLEVAAATLSTARNEFTNAAARITDADIAQESAELLRLQILRSSSSALLAQANQQPQLALLLLKG